MADLRPIERAQDITLRIIIIAAAVTAVVHEVWKSFPDWALTVILFLAVLAILSPDRKNSRNNAVYREKAERDPYTR